MVCFLKNICFTNLSLEIHFGNILPAQNSYNQTLYSRRVCPQQMEMDGFLNLWIIKPGPINNHQQNCCKYYLHNRWTDGQKDECSDKKWTRKRREQQRENKFRFLSRLQQSWPRHLYKQQVETEEGEQVTILLLQSLKCF